MARGFALPAQATDCLRLRCARGIRLRRARSPLAALLVAFATGAAAPLALAEDPADEATESARESRPSEDSTNLPSVDGAVLGSERAAERERILLYQIERDILARRSGVLLPAGRMAIEPSLNYTRFSRNRLLVNGFEVLPAIIVGEFDISEIERDISTVTLAARYGLTNRLELEVSAPFVLRRDQSIIGREGEERVGRSRGDGIGDVTIGAAAHLLRQQDWATDAILSFRSKFRNGRSPFESRSDELPVGSGFWSVSSSLTLVKAADPAVVFGSLTYTRNLERDWGQPFGTIDPGDTAEFGLGLSFALNERIALSMAYQQRITGRATQKVRVCDAPPEPSCSHLRRTLERSGGNSSVLNLSASWAVAGSMTTSFSLGIGLSKDAPDLALELRLVKHLPIEGPSLSSLSALNPRNWFAQSRRDAQGRALLIGRRSH